MRDGLWLANHTIGEDQYLSMPGCSYKAAVLIEVNHQGDERCILVALTDRVKGPENCCLARTYTRQKGQLRIEDCDSEYGIMNMCGRG